ncbi:hypothetical protein OG322_24890 [Streptomyces sp. NBC_01260]|uniref:hypothetical protein n=2 Tax=Streptomyces TaxID=1883 RepID=UPI000F54DE93|nr:MULTISPECIES: hypothetical protein [unclassified Streptomyces]MCX4772532.1 hypothetical protein [Streptomyces sp. NBC_01285]RPK51086.1 hypothetical protein EES39_04870 [Streptomyces sp. ADI92-24]
MAHKDDAVRLRRATGWCRVTGTAALVTGAVTALNLLFPAPENRLLGDSSVIYAVLTALLTALWWAGALLAPPLTAPALSDGPGSASVPERLPRRRMTRATLLPSLFMSVLPLVVVRTIGAHAGPLEPVMPLFLAVAALISLFLLRGWLSGLIGGSAHSGPAELRRDAAAGAVAARRVRVGSAVWTGEGDGRWSASRRLMVSAEDRQIALRTADEESAQFPWLDLESAAVLEGREGWLCWAAAGGSWGDPVEQMGAALVTDDGYVVWGSTDRHVAEAAYAPEHSHPTAPRRVRRAPRASLYRPDVHRYALAMAAVTLLALVVAERGVGPDALSWCLALVAAGTGVRGVYGFTRRLADRPGPGWEPPAASRGREGHGRRDGDRV